MKTTIKVIGVTGAFLCTMGVCSAQAADYRPELDGYFQIGAGPSFQQSLTLSGPDVPGGTKIDFNTGVRVDLAVGIRQQGAWSVEFQTGTLYNEIRSIGGQALNASRVNFDLYQAPFMVNGCYFLPLKGPVSAYVGGGLGAVVSNFRVDSNVVLDNFYETTFAYQGLAGLGWRITDRIDLVAGYRFLGTSYHHLGEGYHTDGTVNHSLLATLRINF